MWDRCSSLASTSSDADAAACILWTLANAISTTSARSRTGASAIALAAGLQTLACAVAYSAGSVLAASPFITAAVKLTLTDANAFSAGRVLATGSYIATAAKLTLACYITTAMELAIRFRRSYAKGFPSDIRALRATTLSLLVDNVFFVNCKLICRGQLFPVSLTRNIRNRNDLFNRDIDVYSSLDGSGLSITIIEAQIGHK